MMRDWNNDIIDTSEFDFDADLNAMLEEFNSQGDDLLQWDLFDCPQTY